jgi:RNA polymerase sigma-70 factor, ECF subfamily
VKEHSTVNARKGNIGVMAFRDHFSLWGTRRTEHVQPWTAQELATRYLDTLFAYVSRRIASEAEAEDIVAEVFMDVCRQLERIPSRNTDPDNDPTLAYLIGMARRKVALVLRKQERRKEDPLQDETPQTPEYVTGSSEGQVLRQEQARMLRQALNTLPEQQRDVLLLKYAEQLSLKEIAVALGKSEGAINSLLQRAREAARRAGYDYFISEREGE